MQLPDVMVPPEVQTCAPAPARARIHRWSVCGGAKAYGAGAWCGTRCAGVGCSVAGHGAWATSDVLRAAVCARGAARTRVAAVVTAASRLIPTSGVAAARILVAAVATTPAAVASPRVTTTGTWRMIIRCCVAADKEASAGLRKEEQTGGAGRHTSRRSSNRKPAAVDCPRPPRP